MKGIFYLALILYSFHIHAQKYDNTWLVGNGGWGKVTTLDFSSGTLVVDTVPTNMPFFRSNVSICDSLGNLEFYTNSIGINNSQHQLMQNGDSLNPGQVANDFRVLGYTVPEGSIAIPHPKYSNKYYLFHQSTTYSASSTGLGEHLYFTLMNMSLNGGLGLVEKKNQVLISDSICVGQLEVVKHGNGKDWWLVQSLGGNNGFHVFLVAEDTITLAHKQYIGNNNRFAGYEYTGQAGFSFDGSKYARYDFKNDLDIFDFDRCTGLFSNPFHLVIQDTFDAVGGALVGGGIEFSPNNRYLYVSSLYNIYQFDLLASNVLQSKMTIASYDGFADGLPTIFGFLQLAPDGKIYGYAESTRYLHTIHNPDLGGTACNVGQHDIYIHYYNGHFLPNIPHYRTSVLAGSPCDTLTSTAAILAEEIKQIKLYPNPTSSSITIETSLPPERVVLYNALGQQILSMSGREQQLVELETRNLENGSYFVSIWQKGKVVTKQFQVLR